MIANLPFRKLARVWHVGTLNPADRARLHSTSMEGDCLSVSECPSAWIKIARLGGSPVQEMNKPDGQFLDVYAVMEDPELCRSMVAWAIDNGWVATTYQWRAWTLDEEGDWGYMICASQEEATAERDWLDPEDAPEGHAGVERIEVLTGTPLLADRLHQSAAQIATRDCTDFAILMWARTHTNADGILWDEEYDPARLSAPRAGIFPERLSEWSARPLLEKQPNPNGADVAP